MVITKSEVNMASQQSYASSVKTDYDVSYTPVLQTGRGITLVAGTSKNATTNSGSTTGLTVTDGSGNSFLSSLNYALDKNGNVSTVGDSGINSYASANHTVRMNTLVYLLRMLLYGSLNGGSTIFEDAMSEAFSNTTNYLVTSTTTTEYSMEESVSFESTGTVITGDGTELSFNYSFSMSDSFYAKYSETCQDIRQINLTDPLVINLDSNPGQISDQKFYFDLDADGSQEEISTLGEGMGFLAIDKDGNGKIDDGRELFGTRSGDGFKDLQAYDEDGNGWIDENDSIFDQLRVMTVNEDGQQELYGLKQSDVGAIYLGRVKTNFTAFNEDNETQGVIRESGIFLHENGGRAGAISHVDLAT